MYYSSSCPLHFKRTKKQIQQVFNQVFNSLISSRLFSQYRRLNQALKISIVSCITSVWNLRQKNLQILQAGSALLLLLEFQAIFCPLCIHDVSEQLSRSRQSGMQSVFVVNRGLSTTFEQRLSEKEGTLLRKKSRVVPHSHSVNYFFSSFLIILFLGQAR